MAASKSKEKDFSFETVAVLCSAILASNGAITGEQYELMSALDGNRSACAFQHQFRAVLARARELKAQKDTGTKVESVKGTPRKPKAKAVGKKRARKDMDDSEDEKEVKTGGEQYSKKVKAEPEGDDAPLLTPPGFNFDFE